MTSVTQHSRVMDAARTAMRGLIRRMVVTKAAQAIWQVAGLRVGDAREVFDAEVFQGIGVWSLPSDSGVTETIVVNAGSANTPAIVACRDEKTRAAMVPASMVNGDTCVYGAGVLLYFHGGKLEARLPNGVAKRLATLDDVNALRNHYANHFHAAPGGNTGAPNTEPPTASGTTILRGQ